RRERGNCEGTVRGRTVSAKRVEEIDEARQQRRDDGATYDRRAAKEETRASRRARTRGGKDVQQHQWHPFADYLLHTLLEGTQLLVTWGLVGSVELAAQVRHVVVVRLADDLAALACRDGGAAQRVGPAGAAKAKVTLRVGARGLPL